MSLASLVEGGVQEKAVEAQEEHQVELRRGADEPAKATAPPQRSDVPAGGSPRQGAMGTGVDRLCSLKHLGWKPSAVISKTPQTHSAIDMKASALTSSRIELRRDTKVSRPPLVSVGMPVFNGERFLREALESVLNQTFTDFELIVSDNASTDSTPEIIRSYVRHDRRIRYHRQAANIGIARNWNFVAKLARGRYFKFASANDEYAANLLTDCVHALEAAPDVVACYGRTQFIGESGERSTVFAGDFSADMSAALARYDVVRSKFSLGTTLQSGMIRVDALRSCGYLGNYLHSDRVLTAGLALHGKIVLLPEVHFYRRLGKDVSTPQKALLDAHKTFNPALTRVPKWVGLRVHAGHLALMLSAPLLWSSRMRGLLLALRYAYWDKKQLLAELKEAIGLTRPMKMRHRD